MRTKEEIKKEITDAVLADETLRTAFGLSSNEEWDSQVSSVSILNLLIYIMTMAARTVEWLYGQFCEEVEERIAAALPGTVSWYWNKVMQFQYGDELNENGTYDVVDETKRIITHCAVLEVENGILVKVNKGDSTYEALTATELAALQNYVNEIKFAGTYAVCYSYDPDEVAIELNIWRNPMVLDSNMNRISDGESVIENAVLEYLNGIVYGGVFNKTKLLDAIQSVDGVEDVTIADGSIYSPSNDTTRNFGDFIQNHRSNSGHFLLDEIVCYDMINQ